MTAQELREKFLKFFESKGHTIIPSASLIPQNDQSVLLTTAGMQQFKPFYANPEKVSYSRATSVQKCLRTNDIEEVGDETHLTFFEMLGNFSFGYPGKKDSYFKEKAIQYAWEFLTETLGIEKSRIYATYFKGEKGVAEDEESLKILKTINDLRKIKPQGFEDNFWSLGTENSPGGPTVEFYVDDIEVWNCVFNEYILKNGKYEPLENKGVDTGMGLERLLAVMNKKETVFETDLFQPLIEKISEISGKNYDENEKSFRIIADHIKAATFMIADGVTPLNVGQGYVLRRLIRRVVRYGKLLGIENDFTKQIAEVVVEIYKEFYQELEKNKDNIFTELEKEENKFIAMIGNDKDREKIYASISPSSSPSSSPSPSEDYAESVAEALFKLYTEKGFPLELGIEEMKNRGNEVDDEIISIYKEKIKQHQDISRTASAGMFKGGLQGAGEMEIKYHTATHLLLAALRQLFGQEIYQKGSNITAERLRFDFNYPTKMTPEQLKKVEDLVNEKIQENLPVMMEEMTVEEAKKAGAMGVFEAKYGDKVKVYSAGDFSKEICGGPHAKSTGELGHFKIVKEEASSAGVRRIKAILE